MDTPYFAKKALLFLFLSLFAIPFPTPKQSTNIVGNLTGRWQGVSGAKEAWNRFRTVKQYFQYYRQLLGNILLTNIFLANNLLFTFSHSFTEKNKYITVSNHFCKIFTSISTLFRVIVVKILIQKKGATCLIFFFFT